MFTSLSLFSCGGSSGSKGQGTGPATVKSITISLTDTNVGQQQQLTAAATYSDGTTSAISPQSWASSDVLVASVSSAGVAAGISHGQSTISATFSDVTGTAILNVHGGSLAVTLTGAVTGVVAIAGTNGFTATLSANQTVQVPPGAVTVVGNPASNSTSNYFPTTASQSVTVADGAAAAVTVDYATIIPKTTKVLDAAGLNSLVVVDDQSSISFSSSSTLASSLNPGDIVAIAPCTAAPSGLLLSVVAVSPGSNSVTVVVQSASLADAIQQATVSFSQDLGPNSLTSDSKKMLIPSLHSEGKTPETTLTGACTGNSSTLQFPYSSVLAQDSSGNVTLAGEVDLCSTVTIALQLGFFKLQSLNATVSSGLHTSIGLTSTIEGAFSKTQNLPSFTGTTITIMIGNVPIGFTPVLTPYVGASGNADASLSTTVTTDTTMTNGVAYSNGNWTAINSTVSPTAVTTTTSADANASIKGLAGVTVGVDLDQKIIPTLGATVSASGDGYLQLTAGVMRNPCWSLDGGLEGSLAVSAHFLDKTTRDYSDGPFNLHSFPNIAQATGPCDSVTITPAASNIDVGETVQLTATEVDALGNTVDASFDWESSDTTVATVDEKGNVTAVSPGSTTITATDSESQVSGKGSIVVGGAPPSYFLVGDWVGTLTYVEADDGSKTTFSVGSSLTQTETTFNGSFTGLEEGDVSTTFTVVGKLAGSNFSFSAASNQDTDSVDATGTISEDGMQVIGSGIDGSNGSMDWDGNLKISGSVLLAPGAVDYSENLTWTGSMTTDGQHLTGTATASNGDTITWNLTRQ
jgi:hypothetical protein